MCIRDSPYVVREVIIIIQFLLSSKNRGAGGTTLHPSTSEGTPSASLRYDTVRYAKEDITTQPRLIPLNNLVAWG